MRIQIQAKGMPALKQLREHARHRLQFALGRFAHGVSTVRVHLADVNGPRGGTDKLCRIVVQMKQHSQVVIQELGQDMQQVIDRVADRVHQNVSRQLGRINRVQRPSLMLSLPPDAV